jgi:hypothetical protein
MSAAQVVPLRKPGSAEQAHRLPPLPATKAPPPLASMRVPKGVIAVDAQEEDDWAELAAIARARADEDDWERALAVTRARLEEEERAWAEAMARAKRIAALEPSRGPALVASRAPGVRPQRPPRPGAPRPAPLGPRSQAPVVVAPKQPVLVAPKQPVLVAPKQDDDEEAEWQRLRARVAAQPASAPQPALTRTIPADPWAAPPVRAQPAPVVRVVAWP